MPSEPEPISWQSYVDDYLVAPGASKAAIIGLSENPVEWAKSLGYEIELEEKKRIVEYFEGKNRDLVEAEGEDEGGRKRGLYVQKKKYIVVHLGDSSVQGRGLGNFCKDGIILVKTTKAVLIAEYSEPNKAEEIFSIVIRVAEHLRDNGS